MRWRSPRAALTAFALLLFAPASALAERAPVELSAEPIFGADVVGGEGPTVLLITATNHAPRALSGTLELSERYGMASTPWRMHLDLPPGATRVRTFPARLNGLGQPSVRFVTAGYAPASADVTRTYNSAQGIVVLSQNASLRAALGDIVVQVEQPYGGMRNEEPPVGEVRLAPSTGDPLLPAQPSGYHPVLIVVAEASLFERIGGAERRALEAWIRSGGHLLVFPRVEADVRLPHVRELFGEVALSSAPRAEARTPMLPPGDVLTLTGEPDTVTEVFGLSRRVGFGRVYLSSYDLSAPDIVSGQAPAEVVRSIVARRPTEGVDRPIWPLFGASIGSDQWGPRSSDGLRASLDPNESFRPALGLVSILLLIYVLVVGPVNFAWVERRKKPVLALVSTPIVAAGCFILLLGVGYVGKGVLNRYRRVELVEAVEGDDFGTSRAYTGLFATRPVSFDLGPPALGTIWPALAEDAVHPEWIEVGDGAGQLKDMRAALWETAFLRQDSLVDLGGQVTLTRDGARLAEVVNQTTHDLHGAFVADTQGNIYPVGEVPAGGRAAIEMAARLTVAPGDVLYDADDPRVTGVLEVLGFEPSDSDARAEVYGLLRATGGPALPTLPSLWARLDPEGDEPIAGVFRRERELRLLRITPVAPATPVPYAYPPSDPPMGGYE